MQEKYFPKMVSLPSFLDGEQSVTQSGLPVEWGFIPGKIMIQWAQDRIKT